MQEEGQSATDQSQHVQGVQGTRFSTQEEDHAQTGILSVGEPQESSHLEEDDHRAKSGTSRQKKKKPVTPPTIGVMFVDQTPGGLLSRRLQEVEDRLAKASGYRIRMVEADAQY